MGGNSWNNLFSSSGYDLGSLHFVDSVHGFAMGGSNSGGGNIISTQDAGANWSIVNNYDTSEVLWGIFFTDPAIGYAHGNNGLIKKTTDGGNFWTVLTSGTTLNLRDGGMYFPSASTGYIAGDSVILKTTDAGITWQIANNANNLYSSLFFVNDSTGYAGFYNYSGIAGIFKTMDAGISWQIKSFGNAPSGLHFPSPNIGYGVCYNGQIYKSYDGGNSWGIQSTGTTAFLQSVFFVNDSVGIAVGANGTILKTTNGGGPAGYSIYGTIYNKDQSASLNNGKVYLIEYDSAAIQQNYVDSFILGGGNGDYVFNYHPSGKYVILIRPDEAAYPNTIPTYFGDYAYWDYATAMNLISDTSGIDIHVQETPVWTGIGFCSGTIRYGQGSGKTGNSSVVPFGDPVPGLDVSLEQVPGGIKAHTTTNDSGIYSFSNIPMNIPYRLLVDIPGLPMDSSYSVTISASETVL